MYNSSKVKHHLLTVPTLLRKHMALSSRSKKVGILGATALLSLVALMVIYPVVASSMPGAGPSKVATSTSGKGNIAAATPGSTGSQILHPAVLNPSDKFQAPNGVGPSTVSQSSASHQASEKFEPGLSSTAVTRLPGPPALTVGETITFTSTAGQYRNFTNATPIGNASGTVTFTVTGALREGYTLSLTSGSLTLGSTTISVTGGSAVMGEYQANLVGSGTISGGSMIFHATARPSLLGNFNIFSIDLQSGGQEYLVLLQVTSSHS